MASRHNNLLGVGGQRKKVSGVDQQGSTSAREADRRAVADQKQELLRKMRERVQANQSDQPEASDQPDASEASDASGQENAPDQADDAGRPADAAEADRRG
jgi:type IV secretory pathway TrbL component